jgi:hypothetical protein
MRQRVLVAAGAVVCAAGGVLGQAPLDVGRASAAELLADAEGRTLAQDAAAFSVDVHGYTQFRYIYTHAEPADFGPVFIDDRDESATGFQLARTKVNVGGNIINEKWGYFVQMAFAREGGGGVLEDAYGTYAMEDGWSVMFGQFKLPLLREELVGETRQLAVDRSPTNEAFTQMRSQGVQVAHEGDAFRFMGAFSDGIRTLNTDYTSFAEADFGLTARAEWKWAGDWKQFRDFTSFRGSQSAGMVGAAGHYQSGGETIGTRDVDQWVLTADVSVEGDGWNLFTAAMVQNTEAESPVVFFGARETTDWAWLIQGGYFVAPQLEVFGRFDMIIADDDRPFAVDEFRSITAGLNYYMAPESHAAKFTAQMIYFLDDAPVGPVIPTDVGLGAPQGNTLTPLLSGMDDGQFSIVAQMQLAF